jgi:hypothetical protein
VEVLGKNVLDVKPAEQSAEEARVLFQRVLRGESWSGEITLRRKARHELSPLLYCFAALRCPKASYRRRQRVPRYFTAACHRKTERDGARRAGAPAEEHARGRKVACHSDGAANFIGPDDFMASFTSRLSAVAAANDLLIHRGGEATALEELAHAALDPLLDVKRIRLIGPNVMLQRRMILPFSMLLHELYTNAAKYGALSAPAGMIDIAWRRDEIEGRALARF